MGTAQSGVAVAALFVLALKIEKKINCDETAVERVCRGKGGVHKIKYRITVRVGGKFQRYTEVKSNAATTATSAALNKLQNIIVVPTDNRLATGTDKRGHRTQW